jgi:hypothetical protein
VSPPNRVAVSPTAPSGDGLSGGAIAGIVIGSLAGVGLLAATLFFVFSQGFVATADPAVIAVAAPVDPAPSTSPYA